VGGLSGLRSGDAEATESPSTLPSDGGRGSVNKPVFIAAAGSVLVFAVWALAAPASTETVVGKVKSFIATWFGWWYFILSTAIVGLVIFIGASKYGRYRLGPEESRPEYSLFAWTSMLFAAGIGIDLMFFSVAEPVYD
jgi:choline/glycine/proline betaine transport protein